MTMRAPRPKKNKGGRGRSFGAASPSSSGAGGGGGNNGGRSPYISDRLLMPRLEQYALNNDYTKLEETVEYLRNCYPEYRRQKIAAVRQQVERAVQVLQRRPPIEKQEVRLQALEERHLSRKSPQPEDSDDSSDEEDGAGEAEVQFEGVLPEDTMRDDNPTHQPKPAENKDIYSFIKELKESPDGGMEARVAEMQSNEDSEDSSDQSSEDAAGGSTPSRGGLLNSKLLSGYSGASPNKPPEADSAINSAFAAPEVVKAMALKRLAEDKAVKQSLRPSGRDVPAPESESNARAAPVAILPGADMPAGTSTSAPPGSASPAHGALKRKRALARSASKKGGGDSGGGKAPFMIGSGGGGERSIAASTPKNLKFSDLGGVESALEAIEETIMFPMRHPELYEWLGVEPPRGILLHGPPGCGKTTLAHAIAAEAGCSFFNIAATEVVSGMSGESEAKVRSLFGAAMSAAPSIVFIDEIDAITPKRETAQREMERRIVAQLLMCMDELNSPTSIHDAPGEGGHSARPGHVMVIGATNRPDSLDPALRRAGRFDREIALGVPDEAARARILQVLTSKLRLEGDFNFHAIARQTPGYVGADLSALAKEAAAVAIRNIMNQMKQLPQAQPQSPSLAMQVADGDNPAASAEGEPSSASAAPPVFSAPEKMGAEASGGPSGFTHQQLHGFAIRMQDFREAVKRVQPSAIREGFATVPGVTWEDVGALCDVREELSFAISQPIANPERFAAMGLNVAVGVLLFGPPGCGKTLVAKAVANDAHANFISIKGPELLNKYVGESERAVRSLFSRARAASPCVLFFDEMDAIAPRRGGEGGQSAERVVNQLLTELDGLEPRTGVFVVAATNRPDMIDPAMLRPGRLDKLLYVSLPAPESRASIIKTLTRGAPIAVDVDVAAVAASPRCDGFSGADLAALVREACIEALRSQGPPPEDPTQIQPVPQVEMSHFDSALRSVLPSVSRADARRYDDLRKKLRKSRNHISVTNPSTSGAEEIKGAEVDISGCKDDGSADTNHHRVDGNH